MVRTLGALAIIAAALMTAAMLPGGATPAPPGPALAVTAHSEGGLELRASHQQGLLVSARGIVPGTSATGTVDITSMGTQPVRVALARGKLADLPGPLGGRLSRALGLRVTRVRHRAPRTTVYAGPLATMPKRVRFPSMRPGRSRTVEFRISFPDGGVPASWDSGDNRFHRSATKVGFTWLTKSLKAGAGR